MTRELDPVFKEWLDSSMALVRHIAFNYTRSRSAPKYLDEVELEAMAEIARWLNDWYEQGVQEPKWTPATTAKFAWGHALEKVRALFSGVMRTPAEWESFDERRAPYTGVDISELEAEAFVSTAKGPDKEVEDNGLRKSISDAIQKLPTKEALVIQWFYFDDLNKREMADKLGVSPHIVGKILENALKAIKKMNLGLDGYL